MHNVSILDDNISRCINTRFARQVLLLDRGIRDVKEVVTVVVVDIMFYVMEFNTSINLSIYLWC